LYPSQSLSVTASYEEAKEEKERNRMKRNGRKEVKKLPAGERNTQYSCYRHEDEKPLFQVQSSLGGLGKEKVLSEGSAARHSAL